MADDKQTTTTIHTPPEVLARAYRIVLEDLAVNPMAYLGPTTMRQRAERLEAAEAQRKTDNAIGQDVLGWFTDEPALDNAFGLSAELMWTPYTDITAIGAAIRGIVTRHTTTTTEGEPS